MTPSGEPLAEMLDPPPGGLADLRVRIARDERRRATRRVVGGALTIVLLVVAASLAVRTSGPRPLPDVISDDLVAVRHGLAAAPEEPVSVRPSRRGDAAVRRLSAVDDEVAYYVVGTR